ncbi:MAG: peptidylprolyl isomerase [Planctomycetota bacterium]
MIFCIGLVVAGCDHGGTGTERPGHTGERTAQELKADRLDRSSAERDADAPVPRLFVNGDALDVEDILRPIRRELTEPANTLSPAAYQRVLREKIIQEFREQVRSLLLYQEAAKRLGEREEEFLQGLVDDTVRKRVNTEFDGRQARYEKALAEQGLTMIEDRERIRRELVVMRHLHQTVMQRVLDPTRAELVRFFDEQGEALTKAERRKMSLIEIPLTSSGAGDAVSRSSGDSNARDDIAQAEGEIEAGRDFAAVAAKYSKGLHADEGGAWDWLTRRSVREHWEPAVEALFQLPEGAISPILETDEAFFIVRCDAIEPAVEPDFEALQPTLVQRYRDVQFNRLVDERVRELQQKAVFVPENVGRFLQAVADAAPQPQGR